MSKLFFKRGGRGRGTLSEGGLHRSTGMKTEPHRRTRMGMPYTYCIYVSYYVHTRVRVRTCYGQPAARAHTREGTQLVRAAVKTKEYMKEMLITALPVSQP